MEFCIQASKPKTQDIVNSDDESLSDAKVKWKYAGFQILLDVTGQLLGIMEGWKLNHIGNALQNV